MARSSSLKNIVPADKVLASPTKKFFVEMLTRDIDLMDAIMDLVDNCIDGVHRQNKTQKPKKGNTIYKGYYADINITGNEFVIKDNCGGIPEDVAKNYAFKLGREEGYDNDKNLETVGVYGIGMKRAIFKMGLEAKVISHHKDDIFKVSVPKNWSTIEGWFFDFEKLKKSDINNILPESGTVLTVSNLYQNISSRFADKVGFIKDLREKLQEHYGYIIQQGFKIDLNGFSIAPLELNIITADPVAGSRKSIKPYGYSAFIDEVSIEIIIGLYRPPAELEEIDKELDGSFARSTSDNAGITVLCNDRIVLYSDKTYLTGWGDSPVPNYHTQFINRVLA